MKKIYTSCFIMIFTLSAFGQQIDNGSMEAWDDLGGSDEEPANWNSFMSATGGLSLFGSQQVEQSSDIRSGATGMYSARVFSKSTLGIVANGNLTLGRINMGSSTPDSEDNYNFSKISNSEFSQELTELPDSLVFWVKFSSSSNQDSARIHAIIHDAYELHDPINTPSSSHVVGAAGLNYSKTNGQWERKSVPFVYNGPSSTPEFILVTFTTNKIPGGGSAGDEIILDDVSLVYNNTSVDQEFSNRQWVSYTIEGLLFSKSFPLDEELNIYSTAGALLKSGTPEGLQGLRLKNGIYLISGKSQSFKVIAH
jgi:hypothetical protein